jgi:hypothetical protein
MMVWHKKSQKPLSSKKGQIVIGDVTKKGRVHKMTADILIALIQFLYYTIETAVVGDLDRNLSGPSVESTLND